MPIIAGFGMSIHTKSRRTKMEIILLLSAKPQSRKPNFMETRSWVCLLYWTSPPLVKIGLLRRRFRYLGKHFV